MTLRLDADTEERLDSLARATERSKAWLAAQAVKTFVEINEWQTRAIKEGLAEANRRDARFVSHDEVEAWLATWGTRKERKPPL